MAYTSATPPRLNAELRRQERQAQKRHRELQRQALERARLSQLELARLEVEIFESQLEVLLSIHKEPVEIWDWNYHASSIPPHLPMNGGKRELESRQLAEFQRVLALHRPGILLVTNVSDEAMAHEQLVAQHQEESAKHEKIKTLALRISSGEPAAYSEAISEYSRFSEISHLGSSIHFKVHNSRLVECVLSANGTQAIPAEMKSLTASGKLSVKAMPKIRYHELYQDYVCGCVLRLAKEVFALLPVETVLVTAIVELVDLGTGITNPQPILSVAPSREAFARLQFDSLDPSDAIENFFHRGDAKANRRSGTFKPITPIAAGDLQRPVLTETNLDDLLSTVRSLTTEINFRLGLQDLSSNTSNDDESL